MVSRRESGFSPTARHHCRVTHPTVSAHTPLILIHGWGGSSHAWERVLPELLTAGFSTPISAVDLPGSPIGMGSDDATIASAADHVIAVAEQTGTPAVVVGHSLGGQVSLLVHARRPDLIAAEVVVDPAYGADESEAASMRTLAAAIRSAGPRALVDFFESGFGVLGSQEREGILADLQATHADVLASYLESEYLAADAIGFLEATTAVARRRVRPLLAFHSSEHGAGIERALLPPTGSVVRRWDGHGHFLHLEDPARFALETKLWTTGL